jgi:hypothetical protein
MCQPSFTVYIVSGLMSMTTIHIDQWEVILVTTLLIREEQEAKIVLIPDDPLTVRIRFKTDPPHDSEKPKTTLSVEGKGNDGVLVFANWNNSLGAATQEPLEFAEDDQGRTIAVLSAVRKIGKSHQVTLQFMRRGANNDAI